jgi:hypothetical protein
MNISCIAFLERPCFHFSVISQKTVISEDCNKDLELASREPNDFVATNFFMAPENAKIFHVLQAGMIFWCGATM